MGKQLLTKRENSAMSRARYKGRASAVVCGFVDAGFGTLNVVYNIVCQSYPNVTFEEVYLFWNFRTLDDELLVKMEAVWGKIKAE